MNVVTTVPPEAIVDGDYNVPCSDTSAVDTTEPTISACTNVTVTKEVETIPGSCEEEKSHVVKWTVADECGLSTTVNSTFYVQGPSSPPTLAGVPANITSECTESLAAAPDSVTATAECGSATVTYQETSNVGGVLGTCPDAFVFTRTWTATDSCGNSDSQSQGITLQLTTNPTIDEEALPSNLDLDCSDTVPAVPSLDAASQCPYATVTNSTQGNVTFGDCNNDYVRFTTWSFTDDCSNSVSHTQTVTVSASTPPTIVDPPNDVSVSCDSIPGQASLTATSPCSGVVTVTVTETTIPGSCEDEYVLNRVYTATDECGLSSQANQSITVSSVDPTLGGTGGLTSITVSCDNIPPAATVTASNACSNLVTVQLTEISTSNSEACSFDRTINRTWVATDTCGNTVSFSHEITVQPPDPPEFDILVTNLNETCGNVSAAVTVTASSACSTVNVTLVEEDHAPNGNCTDDYNITRTWTAVDECGQETSMSQIVFVSNGTSEPGN